MRFGERLKELRIEKNLYQRQLGELIGYKQDVNFTAQKVISVYECGSKCPTLETCLKLANALDITLAELFEDVDSL